VAILLFNAQLSLKFAHAIAWSASPALVYAVGVGGTQMVTWEKYGRDRHKPAGDWVQTTFIEKVVGIEYRKPDAFAYANAVKKAELQALFMAFA
jgi:hypothetical protein